MELNIHSWVLISEGVDAEFWASVWPALGYKIPELKRAKETEENRLFEYDDTEVYGTSF